MDMNTGYQNYPPAAAYGQPPSPYGQPSYQQQYSQPPQQTQYQTHMSQPGTGMMQPGQQNPDYAIGYQAAVKDISHGRSSGTSMATSLLVTTINGAIFLGIPLYVIYRLNKGGGVAGDSKLMQNIQDQMNPIKKRNFRVEVKDVKFKDVIGIPEAKDEVQQYVNFLKNPQKFQSLGAKLPKGALLTGRPGTGKTLLAKAVAGEAGVPFFSCSGADFIEIFGGSGPKRVRELFEDAKKQTPSVIFVDELDAVGSKRSGMGDQGIGGEENRTTNALLAEMDGMGTKDAVVVLAATNHPEALDSALTRPGRFDRKIEIPVPDQQARAELFEYYLNKITTAANFETKSAELKKQVETRKEELEKKRNSPSAETKRKELAKLETQLKEMDESKEKKPNQEKLQAVLQKQVDKLKEELGVEDKEEWEPNLTPPTEEEIEIAKKLVQDLAERTPGVTPASIATISNEAALVAADKNASFVTPEHVQDAIDNVLIGKKHRSRMSGHGLERVAYHEAGHTVAQWFLGTQTEVIKVSVVPRGRAGGFTQFRQQEELDPKTDEFLFDQIVVMLGGRCAERIFYKDFSTGAQDDLMRAFENASNQSLTYGMNDAIGHISVNPQAEGRGRAWSQVSDSLKSRVEEQGKQTVDRAYEVCMKLLTEKKDKLDELAKMLVDKKEINQVEITKILGPKVITKMPTLIPVPIPVASSA